MATDPPDAGNSADPPSATRPDTPPPLRTTSTGSAHVAQPAAHAGPRSRYASTSEAIQRVEAMPPRSSSASQSGLLVVPSTLRSGRKTAAPTSGSGVHSPPTNQGAETPSDGSGMHAPAAPRTRAGYPQTAPRTSSVHSAATTSSTGMHAAAGPRTASVYSAATTSGSGYHPAAIASAEEEEAAESSDDDVLEKDPRQGLVLAGWRLGVLLGEGPHANVYSAVDQNGKRAAIKLMHAHLRGDELIRKRLFREAIIAKKLSGFGVANVDFNDVTSAGEPFMVMERVLGRNLARVIELANGPLDEESALLTILSILECLDACHDQGVIHRAISPTNVFLTVDGEIRVFDFGSALISSEIGDQDLVTLATELTGGIAPELIAYRGALGDARSDVWSAGSLLLTLLTGAIVTDSGPSAAWTDESELEATFSAKSIAYSAMPLDPRHIQREVSAEAAAIIMRACARQPGQRYPSIRAMRDDVTTLLADRDNPAAGNRHERQTRLRTVLAQFYGSRDELENEETGAWRSAEILRDLFRLVENVLYSARRHGWDHGETEVRLDHLVEKLVAAAAEDQDGIFWINRAYSFEYRGEAFWQPTSPLDKITYNLFDAGFRKMHLLPGISTDEARTFLRWLTLDPEHDLAIEDDMATKYWGLELQHVRCELVSAVVLQDVEDYQMLDAELASMRAAAIGHLRSSIQGHLSGDHPAVDSESIEEANPDYVISRGPLLDLDVGVKNALSEALFNPLPMWRGRIADVLSRALPDALRVGDVERVLEPYDQLVEHAFSEEGHFADALEVFGALNERFDDPRVMARLAAPFSQHGRMNTLMQTLIPVEDRLVFGDELPFLSDRLGRLLRYTSDDQLPAITDAMQRTHDRTMLGILLDYVELHAADNADTIGELLATAHPLLGSNLIAILTSRLQGNAMSALEHVFQNPHVKLHVEAAEVFARYAPKRAYAVLKKLIRHEDVAIRQRAVEAIGHNKLTQAADDLFTRFHERGFHQLPIAERRAVMWTAWQVQPEKAEDALCDLVSSHGLVNNEDLDMSRIAAVEILREFALSDRAVAALEAASKKRWWNSNELRDSATGAHAIVAGRLARLDNELRSKNHEEG